MTNEYENPLVPAAPPPEPPKPDELAERLSKKVTAKWQDAVIEDTEYLDPRKPFTPPDWALSIRNTPFYAFGDYNYLQGQAGNGKSFTLCIYESVILGAQFGELRYIGNRANPKVLHIDTEQSEGNVQLHMRRVYHMAGWDQGSDHSDQYRVLMLRETPRPQDRWAKVIKACHEYKPDFLFLDGMLDVVEGMNKEEDCNMVISEAGALASIFKLCMTGICHENPTNPKAKDNDGPPKPAGHVGSYSQRKGSAGQSTTKSLMGTDATFKVVPKKVRNKDYEGFSFKVRDEKIQIDGEDYYIGIPYWYDDGMAGDPEPEDREEKGLSEDEVRTMILNVLTQGETISFTTLRERVRTRYSIGSTKARDVVNKSVTMGMTVCRDNKYSLAEGYLMEDSSSDPF